MNIYSPIYRKAFQNYLRYGIPIEMQIQLKAENYTTPYYIWHTQGDSEVRPSHAVNNGLVFLGKNHLQLAIQAKILDAVVGQNPSRLKRPLPLKNRFYVLRFTTPTAHRKYGLTAHAHGAITILAIYEMANSPINKELLAKQADSPYFPMRKPDMKHLLHC